MNQIRAIQALNKKEIENGISPDASWHVDYRDTAYVYFGGLPYELSEGDVITIFSQFGEPVFLKLVRDKETGKSKGFGWLKYEDQRSTDLAVDNLGGAEVAGRLLRVDHARYKARDDEDPEEFKVGWEDIMRKEGKQVSEDESSEDEKEKRPVLPQERELALLIRDHDDDDPMKGFLIEEKKKEIEEARTKADNKKEHKHRHRHHHSHRSKRDEKSDGRRDERRHGESRRSRRDDSQEDGARQHRDRDSTRHKPRDDSRSGKRRRRHEAEDEDRERRRRHYSRERSDEPRHRSRRDDRDEDRQRKPRERSRSRSPRRYDD
ncbi:unnamed protein product [Clonostachys rosea f. rosea IK726]|uniref:RRM domain-containing protein n=2 Tax=Bionectria ochroleuca TaxID=29856 RepID=A0A0B7K1Z5_BIOOC|nr:unnamed protein product [Clonostachys rosea f. rosea IK726]